MKPGLGAQIDRGHSLAPDRLCYLLNEGCGEVITDLSPHRCHGSIAGAGAALTWGANADAHVLGKTTNSRYFSFAPTTYSATDEYTIAWRAVRRSGSSSTDGMIAGDHTSTNDYIWMYEGNYIRLNCNGNNISFSSGPTSFTSWADYAITCEPAVNNIWRLYKDGIFQTSVTGLGASPVIFSKLFSGYAAGTFEFDGDCEYFYLYNRKLTGEEISQLHAVPYQFVDSYDPVPWLYSAGGGETGALTAGIDAGSVFGSVAGGQGALAASATVSAAMAANAAAQGAVSAAVSCSSSASAIASAVAAMAAAIGAGESWAANAAGLADFTGAAQAGAALLGGAAASANMGSGVAVGESMATGSEFSGDIAAGVDAGASWVGVSTIRAAMSAGTDLGAAFLASAQAVASFTADITAGDVAAAVAQALATLSAGAAVSDAMTATVTLFGADGVLFAEVSITPAIRAGVEFEPAAKTTVRITPAIRGRFTIN